MMIGERNYRPNPMVHVPPWAFFDDSTGDVPFPFSIAGNNLNADDSSPFDALTALHHYLPSNDVDMDSDGSGGDSDLPKDFYSCDQFRMFEFKIRKCPRARSHDWTECPYSHPGEKARRRDPRKFHYSGTACPDFRKGNCKKGDACEYAHGVFECWLHPSRYRTQPCKDGSNCLRRVCFFAHTPEQLRVLSPGSNSGPLESYDGSPQRLALEGSFGRGLCFMSSPESESPPVTESLSRSLGSNSVSEMVASLRRLQLNKVQSLGPQMGFGSPRLPMARPVFSSLPSTPTGIMTRKGIGYFDRFEGGFTIEPLMERVESGRDLRTKMFEKLSRENPLDQVDPAAATPGPDVGWVSELVK